MVSISKLAAHTSAAVLVAVFANNASHAATVERISLTGTKLKITGQELGNPCKRCEVVAHFDRISYALTINKWSGSEIHATLNDIGLSLNPTIQVQTPQWKSQPRVVKIRPRIIPRKRINRFQKKLPGTDLLHFTRNYDSSFGGKGEEEFDVSTAPPDCGKEAPVFHSADLLLSRTTRFAEARIIQQPRRQAGPGCTKCAVRTKYYWEPTGRLAYQLLVYRRVVSGICKSQLR